MAEVQIQPGVKTKLSASAQCILGDASDSMVSSYIVHLADGGSFSGSIVPQARIDVPAAQTGTITVSPNQTATLDDLAFVNTAYFNEATGLYATASIAAVPALITMRASGMACCLNVTVNAGALLIYVQRVIGASA